MRLRQRASRSSEDGLVRRTIHRSDDSNRPYRGRSAGAFVHPSRTLLG
jgi:hypothetical protein